MFAYRDSRGAVDVAFTDRHGGCSTGAYASLNLGYRVGDEPEAVRRNIALVADAFSADHGGQGRPPVALMHQVHGAEVREVHDAEAEPDPADALLTRRPGLVLMVRVADCVPVLLADPENATVAAVHTGRRGLVAGVVPRALAAMRQAGARRVVGWLGPRVCGACYEVPAAMRDEVASVLPAAHAETSWGTPALDLGAGVRAQLDAAEVELRDAGRCTRTDHDLFSYRPPGPSVRSAGRPGLGAAVTGAASRAEGRRREVEAGLARVHERVETACRAAGRRPEDVTLTVVTKLFPGSDVRLLHELGVRRVGENRHQEAAAKVAECADLDLCWHFVGSLQSNKAAAVAAYATVVESVDRPKLLAGLSRGAHERGTVLDVLVQVNLDADEGRGSRRGGVAPAELVGLAERVVATDSLALRGVMAVAPPGEDPLAAFRRLADLAGEVRRVEPAATWLSAGMSGDLEAAVRCGATHVRVGSAVLGSRPRGG